MAIFAKIDGDDGGNDRIRNHRYVVGLGNCMPSRRVQGWTIRLNIVRENMIEEWSRDDAGRRPRQGRDSSSRERTDRWFDRTIKEIRR